jgi:starvation-inducible DNA-binding protein
MNQTHTMLSADIRTGSVALLNRHLAAAINLHAQMKDAHWNVRRPGCFAVGELFDSVSDQLAERAAHDAAERSVLVPYPLMLAAV